MKRILAIGSIVALSVFGFAGAANAAPNDAACFGGVHKAINTEDCAFANVGEAVQDLGGGQEKKAFARTAERPPFRPVPAARNSGSGPPTRSWRSGYLFPA